MKRQTFSVLALGTLLAACGPQQSVTPPEAFTPGLYQIDFRAGGSQGAAAQAQPVGSSLRAQGLVNGTGTLELSPQPVTTTGFVTYRDGVAYRHITATFTVRNNTGQALRNLTFLPVIRADADGDPSNDPVTATVAGTPFMSVRRFDGSDASAAAGTLRTVQAQQVAPATGAVAPVPGASAYLSNLEVSSLSAPVPTGMKTTVMNSGWVAATELAANGSTTLTVAVEFPVDPANPAQQPYSFSLLLTDAQDVTGTDVGAAVEPGRILGHIEGWTLGSGQTLRFSDDYAQPSELVGPIAADGQLDARLPVPSTLRSFLSGCSFSGELTVGDFKQAVKPLRAYSAAGDNLGEIREFTQDGRAAYRMYSDSAVTARGTMKNCAYAGTTRFDLQLRQGWNVVVVSEDAVNRQTVVENAPLDSRTSLLFKQATPSIEVRHNAWNMQLMTGGAGVTQDVTFMQTGAISGEFSLETDVPGVSVSPATITLPALNAASLGGNGITAQSIRPQSLNTTLTFTAASDAAAYSGNLNLIVKQNGVVVGKSAFYSTSIVRPTVHVSGPFQYTYSPLTVQPGQTVRVPVNLSTYEYTGPVSVTLIGLPADVTASTETVTIAPSAGGTANIVLTAAASAVPAEVVELRYSVTGGSFMPNVYTSTLRLQIVP